MSPLVVELSVENHKALNMPMSHLCRLNIGRYILYMMTPCHINVRLSVACGTRKHACN